MNVKERPQSGKIVKVTKKRVLIEEGFDSEPSEDLSGSGSAEESDRTFSVVEDDKQEEESDDADDVEDEDFETRMRVYDARYKIPATAGSLHMLKENKKKVNTQGRYYRLKI